MVQTGSRRIFAAIVVLVLAFAAGLTVLYLRSTQIALLHSVHFSAPLTSDFPLPNNDTLHIANTAGKNDFMHAYTLERRSESGCLVLNSTLCTSALPMVFYIDAILPDDSLLVRGRFVGTIDAGTVTIDPLGKPSVHYLPYTAGSGQPEFVAHVNAQGVIGSRTVLSGYGISLSAPDTHIRWGQIRELRKDATVPNAVDLGGEDWPTMAWQKKDSGPVDWTLRIDGHLARVQEFGDGSLLLGGTFVNTLKFDGATVLDTPGHMVFLVRWTPDAGVEWARALNTGFGSDGFFTTHVTEENSILLVTAFGGYMDLEGIGRIRNRWRRFGTVVAEFDEGGTPLWGTRVATGSTWPGYVIEAGDWLCFSVTPNMNIEVQLHNGNKQVVEGACVLVMDREVK